ncbi:MAG: hypothetical protein V1709_01855 [Planctomycetota bacterium]
MKDILVWALTVAYGTTGIIGLIAYWPTIKDLYYHKKPSANIVSYILWTATSGIAFLYALFILPDMLFIIVSGMSFAACGFVLCLSIRLKNHKISSNSY